MFRQVVAQVTIKKMLDNRDASADFHGLAEKLIDLNRQAG